MRPVSPDERRPVSLTLVRTPFTPAREARSAYLRRAPRMPAPDRGISRDSRAQPAYLTLFVGRRAGRLLDRARIAVASRRLGRWRFRGRRSGGGRSRDRRSRCRARDRCRGQRRTAHGGRTRCRRSGRRWRRKIAGTTAGCAAWTIGSACSRRRGRHRRWLRRRRRHRSRLGWPNGRGVRGQVRSGRGGRRGHIHDRRRRCGCGRNHGRWTVPIGRRGRARVHVDRARVQRDGDESEHTAKPNAGSNAVSHA